MTETGKASRLSQSTIPTTPEAYPTTPSSIPLAALDQSFVLQIMLDLKGSVASLKESVDSLKEQSKEYGKEIHEISKDVHAAKIVGRFVLLVGGFLGFAITILVEYLKKK
jgi:hypothetical protein